MSKFKDFILSLDNLLFWYNATILANNLDVNGFSIILPITVWYKNLKDKESFIS